MSWHALVEGEEEKLKELAAAHRLHPLHVEDCFHGGQNAKLEDGDDYLFLVLKPIKVSDTFEIEACDFDVFLGPGYLISFEETGCAAMRSIVARLQAHPPAGNDQLLYRMMDLLVDTYAPILERFSEEIDRIEDEIFERPPTHDILQRVFCLKRGLIEMRRVFSQTRDVASHLMRTDQPTIGTSLQPYFRDIYDHLTRNLESAESSRDLLTGVLDIYLSSSANRTNQAMKVLALFSAITFPMLAISSFFGMNFDNLPWIHDPYGWIHAVISIVVATIALAAVARWRQLL